MNRFTQLTIFCVAFLIVICGHFRVAHAQTSNSLIETVWTYGHSVQGRPLVAVSLGKGDNVTMILGGIHGNEPSAPGVVEDLKEHLEKHPAELDGKTVVLVSHVCILAFNLNTEWHFK